MIISVESLQEKIKKEENLAILDVRFSLQDIEAGKKAYQQDHIPGAFHLDLKDDLASPAQEHGGDNPLPDPNILADKLGKIGIDEETTVVIYDEDNKMFAARAWWVLHYIGLEEVYILDGGYKLWKEKGQETSTEIPSPKEKTFTAKAKDHLYVNIDTVKEKLASKEAVLIDSRAPGRYRGDNEPLYKKAGHIPGAVNFHYTDVYQEDGTWKSKEELQKVFAKLSKDQEIIVSCGSGVSACPNIIGLNKSGFTNVKLYPGSFSDWVSYNDNEVVKGDE